MSDEEYQILRKMVDETSYVFDHDENSNWSGIFDILNHANQQERDQIKRFLEWQDLDKAEGKVLDDIGRDYGVSRIDNDDNFYRFLIRLAQLKNHTDGSIDSLYKLISFALQADPSEFVIRLGYEIDGEPNAIHVEDIPNKYSDDPRKTRILLKYLEESRAAGIRLAGLTFQENNINNLYIGMASVTMFEENNKMKLASELDNSVHQYVAIASPTQYEETNKMKRRNIV
ncbi:hypothetical protein [Lentilactobacillus senioris]|uniref:hypothetical protein n=1 Tax=Lentilactobacillus senioris TaxID=931534 RepID=UPI003D293A9B